MRLRYCWLRWVFVQNEHSICDVISPVARLGRSGRRESGDGATCILPNDTLSSTLGSTWLRLFESKKGVFHHWAASHWGKGEF